MEKSVSTNIQRLDLDFILRNFLNPKLWEKKWVIFNYDYTTVEVSISTINVKSQTLSLGVRVTIGKFDHLWSNTDENSVTIPYDLAHRNIPLFERQIFNQAIYGMEIIERRAIRETDAYIEANRQQEQYLAMIENIANDFLDEQKVTHPSIRKAYIEKYLDDTDVPNYTDEVLKQYKYRKTYRWLLMLSLFFGYDEDYKKYKSYARINGFKIGEIRKEVARLVKYIETDDFADEVRRDVAVVMEG